MSYQPPGYMYVEGNVLSSVNFDIDIMPKRSNKSIIAGKDIFWLYEAISRYSCTNEDYSLRKIDATHGTISWDQPDRNLDKWLLYKQYDGNNLCIAHRLEEMVHLQVNGSLPYILSSYNNITSACRIDVDRFSIDAWLSCIIPESAKVNNLWSSIASDYKYHLDGGSIDTYNISAMFDMVQKTNFNYFYTNKCCVPSNSWTISGGMLHEVKSNDKFPSDTICSGSGTLSVLNGYYSARYAGICARNRSSSSGSVFGQMSVTYNLQDNAPHVKLGVPVFHAYKDLVGAYCAWKCTFNITRGSENISKYAIVVDKCNVTTDKTLSGVNWFNIWYSSTKDMHKTCGIETPAKDNNNNVYWNYEYQPYGCVLVFKTALPD